ncbi:Hypothetical protein ETA_pET460550 (plasmid) [Erwinia tasmaniensis Et1/99]|uniref:Uncharacterized protein n=1 Tax=Erwinia tasmaniensis (strain DSM 17950 / CFBP 7177 / CIP 109463 / NCPPB 4357 / Et1/99) TaxID=465817 RepID=B2VB57_ERWT9|nr:Hypothetical protein ETA_pET460550 [Erwinia tasmaniensis Et1/99]
MRQIGLRKRRYAPDNQRVLRVGVRGAPRVVKRPELDVLPVCDDDLVVHDFVLAVCTQRNARTDDHVHRRPADSPDRSVNDMMEAPVVWSTARRGQRAMTGGTHSRSGRAHALESGVWETSWLPSRLPVADWQSAWRTGTPFFD